MKSQKVYYRLLTLFLMRKVASNTSKIYVGRMALFLLLIKLLRFTNVRGINIVARTLENILM